MHDAFSVLVIAERLQRQGEQVRFFFGEHGRDLSFGRAMDARVGPALFPAVQIGLRFLETLKALPLERCFLRVADPGLHFSFSIWIMDPASERYRAIVGQDISIQGIESGIVDIGTQHALFQVIENNNSRGTP